MKLRETDGSGGFVKLKLQVLATPPTEQKISKSDASQLAWQVEKIGVICETWRIPRFRF